MLEKIDYSYFLSLFNEYVELHCIIENNKKLVGNTAYNCKCAFTDITKLDILKWCNANFENNWYCTNNKFYFLNEEDYLSFILKFGCYIKT